MADEQVKEPNYAELRDQLEQLRRFLASFFAVGDAIVSIGDVDRVLAAKRNELDKLDGDLAKKNADIDAVRRTQEAEAQEHDAKIAAARDEADRIVRSANEKAADIDEQNRAAREREKAEHDAAFEAHKTALLEQHDQLRAETRRLDEQVEARKRVIEKKNSEIDEANARHAKVKRDIDDLRSKAASLLGEESN